MSNYFNDEQLWKFQSTVFFISPLIIQLVKNISKVISGDNVSKGSKVEIKYDKLEVEAEILGVNGKFMV